MIYSRRNVLCGVCCKRLPRDLLFTQEEREKVEQELREAKRRLHQAMEEHRAREARDHSEADLADGEIHRDYPPVDTAAYRVFDGMVGQSHCSRREQNQAAGAGRPRPGAALETDLRNVTCPSHCL